MATRRRTTTARQSTRAQPARTTRSTRARAATTAREPANGSGSMSVREAGRKGGLIGGRKGGQTVLRERGPQFYSEIGKKGGQRVRELIALAKQIEEEQTTPSTSRRGRRTSR